MTIWILAVLVLFFVQTMLAPTVQWLVSDGFRVREASGPRDTSPPMSKMSARLDRALKNMVEAMFLFLPLALLADVKGLSGGLAENGAGLFLVARTLYIPAYISGIPGLRSAVWMIGHAGIGLMAAALL